MATNNAWLDQVQEETLEPDLPICDLHHHLWDQRPDRVEPRYMMDEILVDLNSGHNIVSTVFVQCSAMHRVDGPEAMRPVGETEFVNGIAAMSASGLYGATRIAAGIVGQPISPWAKPWPRCWRRMCKPEAAGFAAFAKARPGIRRGRPSPAAWRNPISTWMRIFARATRNWRDLT